ncbi:MAG TPA: ATP-dependent protease [Deltaproteobacteria bacterium]|nr:ATP-dependent protease [Deltaproteobacteria bacterium]HBG72574.1 ATP-dependent protease [Deltaproteobacteria bacterium]
MARPLNVEELRNPCDPKRFRFETTDEVAPLSRIVGQQRALAAIDFGLNMHSLGFNIYVLGESGTGKASAIRTFVSEKAKAEPVPTDWAYVFNFSESAEPIAVSLSPGRGVEFQRDMEEFVAALKVAIPKVFESKEYEQQKSRIMEAFQRRQKELFGALELEAESKGFSVRATISGFSIVAVDKSGEAITEEKFGALGEREKRELRERGRQVQERLDDVVRNVKAEDKANKDALAELERNTALSVLGTRLEEIRKRHEGNGKLLAYLDAVQEDMLANLEDFKGGGEEQPSPLPFLKLARQEPNFSRYSVNVIVNNGGMNGSPCVFESNPTYYNLFGRIEHKFQMGAALTDFTMIKAGALHKANGGFLVIGALDLLRNIFSYDALKRAVRTREVKIEDVWEQYRLVTTTTMKPEPIPLNVKVILIGNPEIYYLLYNLDEEYRELFKVKADFDHRIERTEETMDSYAAFVATKAKEEGLLPFDAAGVARVVEFGSRLAEDQGKLSTKFSDISNLLREACYWAKKEGAAAVSEGHVQQALRAKILRNSRIEERMRESTAEGTLIVETGGETTGQVNGLAVYDMGDYSFGKPSRITATVYAGKGGVLNIERETKLSGKIHEKAVLILSNYLGRRFAGASPINLTASLTFEQLYGIIEGDSATCAELYALLSALSGSPVRQGVAVTGSMDQNGAVQPIGGVNEKIEGFFDLCRLRGLDGTQGVLIPRRNRRNLMLKDEVLQAVRDETFRIFEIDRVEEGVEILMGVPAGEIGVDGKYPEGTLYRKVADRIDRLREAVREKNDEEKKRKKENDEAEGKNG